MASNAKVRKQALSFVRSLSDSLLQDVGLYYEAGLKEGFSECIAAMPEGKLKQELLSGVDQYCASLMTAMKKQGRLRLAIKAPAKKRLRKTKPGYSPSKGPSPSSKDDAVEARLQVNALTEGDVEESLRKIKRIGYFEDRLENYCTLARACSTDAKQLQSVLFQWQDELCDYEEDGRFPQLLAVVQFCLIATAGFGMKVEESYTLVWLQFCTRILNHLVHSPRGLSPKQWSILGDQITKTIAIAKLRTSEDPSPALCEQFVAILSLYIEVAMLQNTATAAHIKTLMHSLLGSSPVYYLDVLLSIPLPSSNDTGKQQSLLHSIFRYALCGVYRVVGYKEYAKFVVACSLCLALVSEEQSGREVREIALGMPVPDGFVKTICSDSPCLAERAGVRPDTKTKQVASLLLRSLDDSTRADMMRLFDAETKGQSGSQGQQHFGQEEGEEVVEHEEELEDEEKMGDEEEMEDEEKMEDEEEAEEVEENGEEDGSVQISPILDFLSDDLDHTDAHAEGEFVWKKQKDSIPKRDGAKPGTGWEHEEDFLPVEDLSSDSTEEPGSSRHPQQAGKSKRPKNKKGSHGDELTERALDCSPVEMDQSSSSVQRRSAISQKRISLRQQHLPPIPN